MKANTKSWSQRVLSVFDVIWLAGLILLFIFVHQIGRGLHPKYDLFVKKMNGYFSAEYLK